MEQNVNDTKDQLKQNENQFKYEMTYLNGGFNGDSIKIEPGKDGKLVIEIPIYGGGQKKTMSVNSPKRIQSLVSAIPMAQDQNDAKSGQEVNSELQKHFDELKLAMSQRFIELFKEVDAKAKQIIVESLKEL